MEVSSPENQAERQFEYDAFLSYSTSADYQLARNLEAFLESFHRTKTREAIQFRELRICRDGSDFSVAQYRRTARGSSASGNSESEEAEVRNLIGRMLEKCRYLLLVWPGNEHVTPWMDWELEWWMKNRSPESVLLLLSHEDADFGTHAFFSEAIVRVGLNKRKWYDLRGHYRNPLWQKVRDYDDERIQLASDLQGLNAGDVLPVWYRDQKRRFRLRARLWVSVSLVLLVLVTLVGVFWQRAVTETNRARMETRRARAGHYAALASKSQSEDPVRALIFASESVLATHLAGEPWEPVATSSLYSAFNHLAGLSFLPGGRVVAIAGRSSAGLIVTARQDGELCIWQATGESIKPLAKGHHPIRKHGYRLFVALSANGKKIVSGEPGGETRTWDFRDGRLEGGAVLSPDECIPSCYAHSRDHTTIAIGSQTGSVKIIDVDAKPRLRERTLRSEGPGEVTGLAFSGNNRFLAIGTRSSCAEVWDLHPVEPLLLKQIYADHKGKVTAMVNSSKEVTELAIDSNARWLVTGSDDWFGSTANGDGRAKIWALTGEEKPYLAATVQHKQTLTALAMSPDGQWIASGSYDGWVRVMRIASSIPPKATALHFGVSIDDLQFSLDSRKILVTSSWDALTMFRLRDGEWQPNPSRLAGPRRYADAFALDPDDKWALTGGSDGSAFRWDLVGNQSPVHWCFDVPSGPGSGTIYPVVSPDMKWALAVGRQGVQLHDLSQPEGPVVDQIAHDHTYIPRVSLSPKGRWLALQGYADGNVYLYDLQQKNVVGSRSILANAGGRTGDLLWDKQDRTLLALNDKGVGWVAKFASESGTSPQLIPIPATAASYREPVLSADGSLAFIAGDKKHSSTLLIISETAGTAAAKSVEFGAPLYTYCDAALSSDNRFLAIQTGESFAEEEANSRFELWDLSDPEAPHIVFRREEFDFSPSFSPDAKWLFAASTGSSTETDCSRVTLLAWRLSNVKPSCEPNVVELAAHTGRVTEMRFSPDQRWMFSAGNASDYGYLWDLSRSNPFERPFVLRSHRHSGDHGWEVAFSPEGEWLATATNDVNIRLWGLTAIGKGLVETVLPTQQLVQSVQFSPDGHWLATSSSDTGLRLWKITQDHSVLGPVVLDDSEEIANIQFDDASSVVYGVSDKLHFWRLPTGQVLHSAAAVAGRNLTWTEWVELGQGKIYRKTFPELPPHPSVIRGMIEAAEGDGVPEHEAELLFTTLTQYALELEDASHANLVCWRGCLAGFPFVVLKAGEEAVRLAPEEAEYRDSRGLARAMLGDYKGAAEDFAFFVERSDPGSSEAGLRTDWIRQLRQRRNPIDRDVLAQLK